MSTVVGLHYNNNKYWYTKILFNIFELDLATLLRTLGILGR